jgi:CHAT domain-containing protein
VLLSPDGVLGRLAIGALPGNDPGSYLLEAWTIATIAAPQSLPSLLSQKLDLEVPSDVLMLGGVNYNEASDAVAVAKKEFRRRAAANPDAEGKLYAPLDGTFGELNTIKGKYEQIFARPKMTVLQGSGATEVALRREAPRHLYLHLATHGFFAPEHYRSALERSVQGQGPVASENRSGSPRSAAQSIAGYHPGLLSGLALAGANKPAEGLDDGIMTAEEVSTLDLRAAELVVLSACDTGLGEVAGGEGILGLQRSFQVAGARTVIASLWSVDDAATRDLMERFYDNLWSQDMGKLRALREAQLWMLRERGPRGLKEFEGDTKSTTNRLPPFYWAAFILSGDWR